MYRNKVLLRPDHIRILSASLYDYELGQVFAAIADYIKDGTLPNDTTTSRAVYVAFQFLKLEIDLCNREEVLEDEGECDLD